MGQKKTRRNVLLGCLGCTGVLIVGCVIIGVSPLLLRAIGVFGPPAEQVYASAPDANASAQIGALFSEMGVHGVRTYVIPVEGENYQHAFIILDTSAGYAGMNPLETNDDVFDQVVFDLSRRNQIEDLRIERVAVEYRDEQGVRVVAFTASMQAIDDYTRGSISKEAFIGSIYLSLRDTLEYFGISELLQEIQQ